MKTRKTARARRLLAGIAGGVVAAAIFTSFSLALVVFAAVLFYATLRWSFLEETSKLSLRVRRDVLEDAIYADRLAHVTVQLEGLIPRSLRLTLTDRLPDGWTIGEGVAAATGDWGVLPRVHYGARPPGRGTWRFQASEVTARDAYGLFEATMELPAHHALRVNASLESVRRGRAYARSRPFEPRRADPLGLIFREFEFEGVREFQIGDRLRDIDWKSTTRLRHIMTKVYSKEKEGILYCLIDASRTMREKTLGSSLSMLDHAAELVLQVGEIASQRNFQLGLVVFDETGILVDVPASRSRGHERILAERVLELPPSLETVRRLDRGEIGVRPLVAEDAFLARARRLRGVETSEAALAFESGRRRPAAAEAVRRLVAIHPPGSLFVFYFSDLASAPEDALAAAAALRARQHKLAVAVLPESRYLEGPTSPVARDVEAAYRSERARVIVRAALQRKGVIVVDLDPTATITRVTEEVK